MIKKSFLAGLYALAIGAWAQTKMICPSDSALAHMGVDVAQYNDYSVLGAYEEPRPGAKNNGAFYLYKNGTLVTSYRPAINAYSNLGWGVEISDKWVAAVAPGYKVSANSEQVGAIFMASFNTTTNAYNSSLQSPILLTGMGFNSTIGITISGDYMAVGSPNDHDASNIGGAVQIFKYNTSTSQWTKLQKIYSPEVDAQFGKSVAMDGNYMIVGAPRENNNQGAVYFYKKNLAGTFDFVSKFYNPSYRESNYGEAVDIQGNRAIAVAAGTTSGTCYDCHKITSIFELNTAAQIWENVGNFEGIGGEDASIYGTNALVSDVEKGLVSMFQKSNNSWQDKGVYIPSDVTSFNFYGSSVSIHQNFSCIGYKGFDKPNLPARLYNQGAGYFISNTTLAQNAKITKRTVTVTPDQTDNDAIRRAVNFGNALSYDNGFLMVGDDNAKCFDSQRPNEVPSLVAGSGEISIFENQVGNWVFKQRIKPPRANDSYDVCTSVVTPFNYDFSQNREMRFGQSIASGNGLMFVAAPRARKPNSNIVSTGGPNDGAVYVYQKNWNNVYAPAYSIFENRSGYSFFASKGVKYNGTFLTVHTVAINGNETYLNLYKADGNVATLVKEVKATNNALTNNHILATIQANKLVFEKLDPATNQSSPIVVPETYTILNNETFEILAANGSTVVASIKNSTGTKRLRVFSFNLNHTLAQSYDVTLSNSVELVPNTDGVFDDNNQISFVEGTVMYVTATSGVYKLIVSNGKYTLSEFISNGATGSTMKRVLVTPRQLFIANRMATNAVETFNLNCNNASLTVNLGGQVNIYDNIDIPSPINEPNESIAAATTLSGNQITFGTMGSKTDQDFYKITLSSNANLKVLLSNLDTNDDFDLFLLNSSNSVIAQSDNGGNVDDFINIDLAAGTYYAKVVSFSNNFPSKTIYKLSHWMTKACQVETTDNQASTSATPWAINTNVQGSIATVGDVDFYALNIANGGNINLQLSNFGIDLDMSIIDKSGNAIASAATTNSTENINTFYLGTGQYFVKIYSKTGVNADLNCYTLSNNFAVSNCNDTYESNNTQSTAKAITVNKYFYGNASISSKTDEDWYTFTTSGSNTNIRVRLDNVPVGIDYDIVITGQNGVNIPSENGSGSSETIVVNVSGTSTYHIRVYGYLNTSSGNNFSPNCYTLTVEVGSTPFTNTARMGAVEKETASYNEEGVSLSPNPVSNGNYTSLYMGKAQDGMILPVKIMNLSGNLVSQQSVTINERSAQIDIQGLSQGIYLIDAGQYGKVKLIVE